MIIFIYLIFTTILLGLFLSTPYRIPAVPFCTASFIIACRGGCIPVRCGAYPPAHPRKLKQMLTDKIVPEVRKPCRKVVWSCFSLQAIATLSVRVGGTEPQGLGRPESSLSALLRVTVMGP